MILTGDCDVCGNSRVRPGVRRKEELDACPRCTQIAEMQWVYHVEMTRAGAVPAEHRILIERKSA